MPFSAPAQKTAAEFHQMLTDTYKQTVPLFSPDTKGVSIVDSFQILDTRELAEYKVSHLPGAIHVGYDAFSENRLADLDKNKPVIVYCSIGYRSERIGEKLLKMGFTDVQNLYGGIFWWKYMGLPIVDQQEAPTEKVHTYNRRWGQWLLKGEPIH